MEIKDLDRKILIQLLQNSKQSNFEIAKKTGITRQTVAKKIEQLKELDIIKSFTVRLKPENFGLNVKAYIFLREEPKSDLRKRNEEIIRKLPQVSEFYRIFGRFDAILEILVKDKDELTKFVKRIHKLKGMKQTETFIVHSVIKNKPEDPLVKILNE